MIPPVLWTDEQISEATQAHCTAPFTVSGVSIDTRSLEPGDLFVALPGSGRDGHDFVDAAFAAGATPAAIACGSISRTGLSAVTFLATASTGADAGSRAAGGANCQAR